MELEKLMLFVEVMRVGGFADVARARGLAPSSISRAIAGLEQELGVRLFQRSTRKLEPTAAGLAYLERIAPLIGELESARQAAADALAEPRGRLRVTAPVVFGERYLVPLLPELARKYPLLSLDLLLNDAIMDLIEDRLDAAIRLGSLQNSSFIAKRLMPMHFSICASPAYVRQHGRPHAPRQITGHQCLLFPRYGYNLNWLFRDAAGNITEIPIQGKYLLNNSQAIRLCALSGMGLALLPDWLVQQDFQSGALVKLFEDYAVTATDYESAVWLLYPSRQYLPHKTRVFMDYLADSFRAYS